MVYGSRCQPEPSLIASSGRALPMKLNAPSCPNRSAPLGTTIFRSKPTVPDWPWASGAGRVMSRAVQPTVSAPAVPPVTLLTVIGVVGQEPW